LQVLLLLVAGVGNCMVWMRFGIWLLLSLEFQLGADIIRTAISPI
jgi:uncharacterized membrane protein